MGHQVAYVVFVAGQEFNESLAPSHRASEVDLALLAESGSLWDGRFQSPSLDFSVELTGAVTLIWLPEKYSRFISDSTARETVLSWERELARRFSNRKRVRIDEFLLNTWEAGVADYWFRDANAVDAFQTWLTDQDPTQWEELP